MNGCRTGYATVCALLMTVALMGVRQVVVCTIDNLSRPLVTSSATRVQFLMVLLGVLGGGAIAFGFAGLVLGPEIVAVISALWVEATARKPEDK